MHNIQVTVLLLHLKKNQESMGSMDTIGQCNTFFKFSCFQWYSYHSKASLDNFVKENTSFCFNVAVIKVS